MESVQVLDSNGVSRIAMGYSNSNCNEADLSNDLENNNFGENLVDELDSYMEDIKGRLTISRMVSDSVIKGMVSAVSQEAVEVVAAKELEIAELKEVLRCRKNAGNGFVVEHGDVRESLCALNRAAKEQLERLGEDIANLKGNDSVQISDTRSAFYSLKATLEAMSQQIDAIVPAKDLKVDLEIRGEVEATVFCAIFQSMREDYEKRMWDVDAILGLVDRFKEISSLHHELDSIQKCFSGTESRSQEIDHVHRKVLSNHGPLWDKKCEESKFSLPETLETSQLKHMAKEELYNHFRIQITKMKREHESTVQQMTEEYFAQKRAILKEMELQKERGPIAAFKKEKDFEELRKKISKAILKLDDILVDSEKLSEFCNHSRDILDNLLSDNRRLRGLLNDRKQELHHLSLQASDATKTEESLHKLVGHLKSALEDAHIETAVREEVYDCILREVALQIKSENEDLDLMSLIMQDIIGIIYEEAGCDAEVLIRSDYRDSNPDSTLMQHVCEIVYQQVLRDVSTEFTQLQKKFLEREKSLVFLESKISKSEEGLQKAVEENEKLSLQVSELENLVTVKDKLLFEATTTLAREKEQFELINEECIQLMNLRTKHDAILSEKNEELILLKDKLDDCQKQIDVYMIEVAELKKANEEKAKFISVLELEQNDVGMLRMKDREHRKQMESMVQVIEGLSKSFADFERRISEKVCWHNVRLENSDFQLHSLVPKINILRRKTLLYKERLDKRCSDLQKAEAEVDLLGDEVDALLSLLEKIYVALDHYSPILQHYPGIIEILKLVRRELSGEGIKAVGPAA